MISDQRSGLTDTYRRWSLAMLATTALLAGFGAGCGDDEVTTTTPTAVTGPTGATGEQDQAD